MVSQIFRKPVPNDVLFDVVKFGGMEANTNSITSSMGTAATINVDLTTPTRTAYSFNVDFANASSTAIYSVNSYSFVVYYFF